MPVAISALAVVSDPGFAQSLKEEYRKKTIGLSGVPQAAVDAAQKALGTAPTEAKHSFRAQTHRNMSSRRQPNRAGRLAFTSLRMER